MVWFWQIVYMKESEFHIGCSGYYYPSWKGKFYPKDLKPKEWLTYYSTVFNTVELNGTFYKLPKAADLKKYHDATDNDFTFSAKMSRYVTHIKRLKDCKDEIVRFHDLLEEGLQKKLASILYQMPPSFSYNEENLNAILENIPRGNNVVELRNQSWWNDEVFRAFTKAKITFCNIDFPGLISPIAATTPLFYMRFHGNPELFKSQYTLAELKKVYKQIPDHCTKANIYFNNTYYDAGYTNAAQMQELTKNKTHQKATDNQPKLNLS